MPTDNRAALLKGARVCIEQIGYARTTARDVANAAGVSLGAIGYHFGSKDELLNEAIAEGFRDWIVSFAGLIGDAEREGSSSPAGGAALGGLESLVGRAIPELYRLMETSRPLLIAFIEALAQAEHVPVLRAQLADQYRQSRAVASEMIAVAVGPRLDETGLDASTLSSLLIALVDGLVMQYLVDPDSTPGADDLLAFYGAGVTEVSAAQRRP